MVPILEEWDANSFDSASDFKRFLSLNTLLVLGSDGWLNDETSDDSNKKNLCQGQDIELCNFEPIKSKMDSVSNTDSESKNMTDCLANIE